METQNATYTWTLNAYEQQGNLWLSWSTTAPFRAQQGQICVYANESFPPNPQDLVKAYQWAGMNLTPWDSGQLWGSGWYCAWIAEADPNGPYVYNVQLITS